VTEAFGQVLEADHGNVFIGGGSGGGKAELKAGKLEQGTGTKHGVVKKFASSPLNHPVGVASIWRNAVCWQCGFSLSHPVRVASI
jgi:hypothetical protein